MKEKEIDVVPSKERRVFSYTPSFYDQLLVGFDQFQCQLTATCFLVWTSRTPIMVAIFSRIRRSKPM